MSDLRGFACVIFLAAACGSNPPARCDSSSCLGCCDANHICHPGGESSACGAAGNACVSCGTALCVAGVCSNPNGSGGGAGGAGGSVGGGSNGGGSTGGGSNGGGSNGGGAADGGCRVF